LGASCAAADTPPTIGELLLKTYPEGVERLEIRHGRVLLVMRDGSELLLEDGKASGFEARLEMPDLVDMFYDRYPKEIGETRWPENLDPGRYRPAAFFKSLYGKSEQEVRGNLERVDFLGHAVWFNRRQGAAAALRKVAADLDQLLANRPELRRYIEPLGGTFAWRQIANTNRLSAHAYGIAIDLNPNLGDYWMWSHSTDLSDPHRRLKYPQAIVAIFERHGFIWGGKWYHYDLMHFEYRPELTGSRSEDETKPTSSLSDLVQPAP